MKNINFLLLITLVALACIHPVRAQQYAVTEDGKSVILHRDGTWEYLRAREHLPQEPEQSGIKARLLIDEEIMIFLNDGQLEDFSIQTNGSRLYDNINDRLKRIGRHEIEYDFRTDRVKKIGKYTIDYDFFTDKVKKIGEYPIEYDFKTGKISRIGNTRFEYSFFHGKLTDISGNTPGVKIILY